MDPFLPIQKSRTQNYGRVSRNGAKNAILAAKVHRERRRMLQNQINLALILQSRYRGIQSRRSIVHNTLLLYYDHNNANSCGMESLLYLPKLTIFVNYRQKLRLISQQQFGSLSRYRKRRIADVVIELLQQMRNDNNYNASDALKLTDMLCHLNDWSVVHFNRLCELLTMYANANTSGVVLQKLIQLADSVYKAQGTDDLSVYALQLLSLNFLDIPSFIDWPMLLQNLSKYIHIHQRELKDADKVVDNIQSLFMNKKLIYTQGTTDGVIAILSHIIHTCYKISDTIPDFMEVEDELHDKFECLSEQSKVQPILNEIFLYNLAINSAPQHISKAADLLAYYTHVSKYSNLVIKLAFNSKFVDTLVRNKERQQSLTLSTLFGQVLSFADVALVYPKHDIVQIVRTLKHRLQSGYQQNAVNSNQVYEFLSFYHTVMFYNLLYTKNIVPAELFEFDDFNNTNLSYTNLVLKYSPQAIPFLMRYQRFSDSIQVAEDQAAFNIEDMINGRTPLQHNITIRRSHLMEDAVNFLSIDDLASQVPLKISLVNQFGVPERGIDGGGLFREFLQDLSADLFLHSDYFIILEHSQQLWYNPTKRLSEDVDMLMYAFMGAVLGKVMTSQILIDAVFAIPLLKPCCMATTNDNGRYAVNTLADLELLDSELYTNLQKLRNMDDATLLSLDLRMCYEDNISPDSKTYYNFVANGKDVQVSSVNVVPYIHYMAHYKLNVQCHRMATAFRRGFRHVLQRQHCDVSMLFGPMELQKLISGDDATFGENGKSSGIDVEGLQKVIAYSGGFHPSQPIIQWFWEVLYEFTGPQQRSFLKFMTSCQRQPLLGFAHMVPVPCIQQIPLTNRVINSENDFESISPAAPSIKLPSSATCMNLLKLPKYTSKIMLKEKLLYAIEAGSGFELS